MAADDRFEARLSTALSEHLDASSGPHPRWFDAPAARRVEAFNVGPTRDHHKGRSRPWDAGVGLDGHRIWAMVAVTAFFAVVVGATLFAVRPGPGGISSPSPSSSIVPTARPSDSGQPPSGLVIGPFPYGTLPDVPPALIAATDGSVWLRDGSGNAVRFDPTTNTVTTSVAMGQGMGGIASGSGSIWATGAENGRVIIRRIDPTTGAVLLTTPYHLGDVAAAQIAMAADEVWIHSRGSDYITRMVAGGAVPGFDFGTSRYSSAAIQELLGTGKTGADAAVWAGLPETGAGLVRIPLLDVPKLAVGFDGCGGLRFAADETGIWTVCGTDLVHLDLVTGDRQASKPLPQDLGAPPHAIAVGRGWVWLAAGNAIVQLDAATGRIIARNVLSGPGWPVFAGGKLVVADQHGSVSVITPVRP